MKKILVAYDGGEPAKKALATAIELAKTCGARLGVVSVVPYRPGRVPVDPWDDASVHARELLEAKKAIRDAGLDAELIEPAGEPARTIERVAEEGGYDTIVVGSRGLGMVERLLQGSVSEHLATHAHQTVVIAR
jgi:nucleotide-binding universal stress UspA family protein